MRLAKLCFAVLCCKGIRKRRRRRDLCCSVLDALGGEARRGTAIRELEYVQVGAICGFLDYPSS